MPDPTISGWAILELMGHRRRLGYVREAEVAGSKLLRIDVLCGKDEADQDITITEFYGTSAVYALRFVAEDIVRDAVREYDGDPRPVRPATYRERPAIAGPAMNDPEDEDPY